MPCKAWEIMLQQQQLPDLSTTENGSSQFVVHCMVKNRFHTPHTLKWCTINIFNLIFLSRCESNERWVPSHTGRSFWERFFNNCMLNYIFDAIYFSEFFLQPIPKAKRIKLASEFVLMSLNDKRIRCARFHVSTEIKSRLVANRVKQFGVLGNAS